MSSCSTDNHYDAAFEYIWRGWIFDDRQCGSDGSTSVGGCTIQGVGVFPWGKAGKFLRLFGRGGKAADRAADATKAVDDLDWSIVKRSTGESRYQHVSAHNVPNINKHSHGVFIDDAVTTTNEAWSIVQRTGVQPVLSEGVNVYTVPMGRNVGFAGGGNANQLAGVPHTSVQIIVKQGTTQIITAYPVVP